MCVQLGLLAADLLSQRMDPHETSPKARGGDHGDSDPAGLFVETIGSRRLAKVTGQKRRRKKRTQREGRRLWGKKQGREAVRWSLGRSPHGDQSDLTGPFSLGGCGSPHPREPWMEGDTCADGFSYTGRCHQLRVLIPGEKASNRRLGMYLPT